MARVQGHRVIRVGHESQAQVELLWSRNRCNEGHSEVYRDRCEQKGIGSSIFITIGKMI